MSEVKGAGEGADADKGAGDGVDIAMDGDDGNKGTEDSMDDNMYNADKDAGFTCERVVRAGPIHNLWKLRQVYLLGASNASVKCKGMWAAV